jgi:hypothetical protein
MSAVDSIGRGIRPLTRFVKLSGQNNSLDILDGGRRPVYSLRAVGNVVIASSHPAGRGLAIDTLACPTTQSLTYEGVSWMELLADDKVLLRNSTASCLLDCGANRVVLTHAEGDVTRYVRNLQLWVLERTKSAIRNSSLADTAYTNPVDLNRLHRAGIIMSGPLLIAKPYSRGQTVDSVGLPSLAAVPWLPAFAAGAAMLQHFGDDGLDALNIRALAGLGDAAVICAIMRSLTDITRYLRGAALSAVSVGPVQTTVAGDSCG